jgi:hypothetical protein
MDAFRYDQLVECLTFMVHNALIASYSEVDRRQMQSKLSHVLYPRSAIVVVMKQKSSLCAADNMLCTFSNRTILGRDHFTAS